MSETGDGPMWLVRDEDVLSHLFFAAAEIGKALLEVGGVDVPGTLSFPNGETRSISFFSSGDTKLDDDTAQPGAVIRLKYSQGECAYSFLTDLCEMTDASGRRRWRPHWQPSGRD